MKKSQLRNIIRKCIKEAFDPGDDPIPINTGILTGVRQCSTGVVQNDLGDECIDINNISDGDTFPSGQNITVNWEIFGNFSLGSDPATSEGFVSFDSTNGTSYQFITQQTPIPLGVLPDGVHNINFKLFSHNQRISTGTYDTNHNGWPFSPEIYTSLNFTVGSGAVPGCTDWQADNFDPNATVDDGSCTLGVLGCIDDGNLDQAYWVAPHGTIAPTGYPNYQFGLSALYGPNYPGEAAANYNPTATVDDGSCLYAGCTDPSDPNYEPYYGLDNPAECSVSGCTDPGSSNYDPSAILDDGSCILCVYGCTDPVATINYDPLATCDDGSCIGNAQATCNQSQWSNYNNWEQTFLSHPNFTGDPAVVGINQPCTMICKKLDIWWQELQTVPAFSQGQLSSTATSQLTQANQLRCKMQIGNTQKSTHSCSC